MTQDPHAQSPINNQELALIMKFLGVIANPQPSQATDQFSQWAKDLLDLCQRRMESAVVDAEKTTPKFIIQDRYEADGGNANVYFSMQDANVNIFTDKEHARRFDSELEAVNFAINHLFTVESEFRILPA